MWRGWEKAAAGALGNQGGNKQEEGCRAVCLRTPGPDRRRRGWELRQKVLPEAGGEFLGCPRKEVLAFWICLAEKGQGLSGGDWAVGCFGLKGRAGWEFERHFFGFSPFCNGRRSSTTIAIMRTSSLTRVTNTQSSGVAETKPKAMR